MIIKHYLYNTFLIEHEDIRLAIDPGQNLWIFNLRTLIPKKEWPTISHVLVTHGDPDHYWQADRVASTANAPIIMNKTMIKQTGEETRILAPRRGGLKYLPYRGKTIALDVGQTVDIGNVRIEGLKAQHGPIEVKILGITKRTDPGPKERTGFGSIGFRITIDGKTFVNVGDSLLQEEWSNLKPDVLMLPIGGLGNNTWTMDVTDALEAVRMISPKLVIPCHYNVPFFWIRKMAAADDQQFRLGVEKMGIECQVMRYNDEFQLTS
ncbi:MAG: metal-dependent hydrolase [Acidithiobacillales bacterium SG8_45]|nr:MAG: metal-dependent hydrolase [Acidithiobacillales bacterium SG8_45]